MGRASGVASTPYQGYSGQEVAPVNGQQTAGIGTINEATGNIAAAGAPLSDADIQRYENPYTKDVINATQADFDVQNQRANSTVTGNAAAQGALGGDRVAVAQALTQEAQNRTQAPVIAGLRQAGYNQATQTAENQQRFGLSADQALMSAGQSQIGAGTLQQQTQQAQDTQARQDYYQQQGYPFQVAQWLASIDTGVGSQLGGTSTSTNNGQTTGPEPNPWSQLLGLGLTAAGAFAKSDRRTKENVEKVGKTNDGQTIYRFNYKGSPQTQIGLMHDEVEERHPEATGKISGIGVVDYRKATEDSVEKFSGGRVSGVGRRGYAGGGAPMPYGNDQTWVPQVGGITAGRGAPAAPQTHAPNAPSQQAGLSSDQMKGIGVAGNKIGNWFSTGDKDVSASDLGSASSPLAGFEPDDYRGYGSEGNLVLPSMAARGGRIKRYANGGFADGGAPTFDDRFSAARPTGVTRGVSAGIGASSPSFDDVPPDFDPDNVIRLDRKASDGWRQGVIRDNGAAIAAAAKDQGAPVAEDIANNDNAPAEDTAPVAGVGNPVTAISRAIKAPAAAEDEPSQALAYSGQDQAGRPAAPPAGVGPASDDSFLGRLGVHVTPELKQGLLQAGLAMMASRRGGPGSFLGAVGEGGMAGLGAYSKAQEADREHALEELKLKNSLEDRAIKNAGAPFIRDATGKVVVNPNHINLKKQEAEIEQKIPSGYRETKDGLEVIPGGPADPKVLEEQAKAKAKTPISDEDARATALRYVKTGNRMELAGLGYSGDNRLKVNHYIKTVQDETGVSDEELGQRVAEFEGRKAGQRVLGTQEAKMGSAAFEAEGAMKLARGVIEKLPRTSFLPLNKLIEGYSKNTLNPDQVELYGRAQAIVNTYAAVMARGANVTTDSARSHADALLNTAGDSATWNRMLDTMQSEIDMAKNSPERMRQFYREKYGAKALETDTAKSGTATPKVGERKQFKQGWGVWDGKEWKPE